MAQFSRRYARIEKAREQTLEQIYKVVEGEEEHRASFPMGNGMNATEMKHSPLLQRIPHGERLEVSGE